MLPLAEVALFPTKNGAFAPFLLPHAWPRLTSGSPRRIALGRSGLFSVHFFAAFRRGRLGVLVGRVFRPSLRRLSGLDVGLALVAIGAVGAVHGNYLAKWPKPWRSQRDGWLRRLKGEVAIQ